MIARLGVLFLYNQTGFAEQSDGLNEMELRSKRSVQMVREHC